VSRFTITIGLVVIASIVMLVYGMARYARFSLYDASDDDIAQRYRLVCGAYPDVQIDETKIPVDLVALLPLARRYGHANHILLEDCAAKMDKNEVERAIRLIDAHRDSIHRWVETNQRLELVTEVMAFRQLLLLRNLLRPLMTASDTAT
jgi:hypothetical protein